MVPTLLPVLNYIIIIEDMKVALRIAAAILSVPPDVLAPYVPMLPPSSRNAFENKLRDEVDSAMSGRCSRAVRTSFDGNYLEEDAPLFAISQEETSYVNCDSGLPSSTLLMGLYDNDDATEGPNPSTYGEITILGARQLFHHLRLTHNNIHREVANGINRNNERPKYHFYDLGSGGGRLVIQSYLELPSVVKAVGIELSPSRHNIATRTWKDLVRNGDAARIRKLAIKSWDIAEEYEQQQNDELKLSSDVILHEGDLFGLDISHATHIYISSLCFTDDMLERLVAKIEDEGVSLQIVASLRRLPTPASRVKTKRVSLGSNPWMEYIEMSWTKARGDGCQVYLYSVKNAL